ncbi:hypothetical protein O6H91_Y579500 [Diphasiastrum complanatum]|nr:hypothetical protein O6H91_Y579500 [Diphasiastrum complanatum]
MAYVDHAFSITEDPTGTFIANNRPPVKEVALAVALLALGSVGILVGLLMMYNKTGGDRGHGNLIVLFPAL